MARLLAVAVFALAAGCATLASSGLAVVRHAHPPGAARYHDHVLAAYRYPLFLMRLADRVREGVRFEAAVPLAEGTAALVLALLTVLTPRLARPAPRAIAAVALARVPPSQWLPALDVGPPRRAARRFLGLA